MTKLDSDSVADMMGWRLPLPLSENF